MRVLQVASSLRDWGGIERYVQYLSEGLVSRGHDVVVACPPGSPLEQRLAVPRVPILNRGKHNPASALPYLKLFRKTKFDIVHIHFSPDFLMPAWAAKATGQGSVVLTRHLVLPWSRRKVRGNLRLFDHIIPVSEAVRRELERSGVPRERMTVAKAGVPPLAPDRPVEDIRKELGFQGFTIGFFGRLVPEKGVDVLIHATVRTQEPMFHAVFGDGPDLEALQREPGRNIRFYGRIDNVANAMAAVDAVVIPSFWEEAFPYSALEAMSVGKPIVGANVGGMPELVQPEVNGLLFPKGDSAELARCLDRLVRDPELARSMGTEGRLIQRQDYTVERMAERIESVYLSLVQGGSNSSHARQ